MGTGRSSRPTLFFSCCPISRPCKARNCSHQKHTFLAFWRAPKNYPSTSRWTSPSPCHWRAVLGNDISFLQQRERSSTSPRQCQGFGLPSSRAAWQGNPSSRHNPRRTQKQESWHGRETTALLNWNRRKIAWGVQNKKKKKELQGE